MQLSTHEILVLLGSVLGGGVGVSLVAQFVKKTAKMQSTHLIHAFVVAISVLGAAAQYVMQYHSKLPSSFLGVSSVSIYGFSQLLYRGSKTANAFLGKVYASNASNQPTVSATVGSTATVSLTSQTTSNDAAEAPVLNV